MDFLSAVENRRSIYAIDKDEEITEAKVVKILKHALSHTPSAFNAQSTRMVLLMGENHHLLWDLVLEALKLKVPEAKWEAVEEKNAAFRRGCGTVLFFDDSQITDALRQRYPKYSENISVWTQQANGMNQYVVWTALEAEGMGASLQHYSELIEASVWRLWGIPQSWRLIAQLPFGKPFSGPGAKIYVPLDERLRVFTGDAPAQDSPIER